MTYLAALFSGLLLFASDHPVHWWWLQFVAFVPFWWALLRQREQTGRLWPIGLLAAAGNAIPITLSAGNAPPIIAAAVASGLQWPLVAMLAGRVISRGSVAGPLAAAAVVTLTEVTIWYAVPIFGTAQCCVRPLSAAPATVGFIAFTGVGGLVFVVTAVQALLVTALRAHSRRAPLGVAVVIVAVVAGLDLTRWQRQLGPKLRVAAAGWHRVSNPNRSLEDYYGYMFDVAGRSKARLLVTPETGARVGAGGWGWQNRDEAMAFVGGQSKRFGLSTAIGIWNTQSIDNRIWFVEQNGELVGEYLKTHLIPWLEDYNAGDGTLVTATTDGTRFGGMICQDDNFTDIGRGYGRLGIPLIAVPTNDWPDIREYHLENGIFRAIENGYAVVRAASHGISALISPRGEVVMRHDHVVDGERILIADLSTGDGHATLYAQVGDWLIVGLCVALLLALTANRRHAAAATSA